MIRRVPPAAPAPKPQATAPTSWRRAFRLVLTLVALTLLWFGLTLWWPLLIPAVIVGGWAAALWADPGEVTS